MRRVVATLVASLALVSLAAPASAQRPGGSASPFPLLDVPYVSQGELLCGGAAAAMLMRAAGARGVYAEDFQSLVDTSAGGIHTQDLAKALRARGYEVQVFEGTASLARQSLAAGHPVLALVQDRPGRYHYVVIVGWQPGTVVFHDPARAPFLTRSDAEFDRAWTPTRRWMLVLGAAHVPSASPSDEVDAAALSPEWDQATARFVERDYKEAERLAARAVASDPSDSASWRLLGASRYLSGDPAGALDAWNHAGDPRIDLVRLEGLSRTPHRTVERLIGLRAGGTLTRSTLVRADRRLALLPSRDASRVSYVALPGGLAEVRGAVVERPLYPSRLEWLATGARVAIDRELSLSLANVASAGDRLSGMWRFWEGRPAARADFAFPSARADGIVALSLAWQREHYATAAPSESRQASVTWGNWVGARLRLSAGAGMVEWTDRGSAALLLGALEFRPVSDRVTLELSSLIAAGRVTPFGTGTATLRWRGRLGTFSVFGDHSIARVSSDAPMDHWPGAGSGTGRPWLLRAHPLLHDGRLDGEAFGRTLAQSSLEIQRELARRAFATVGAAAFVDVARVWQRPDGSTSPLHVDAGLGLRLRLGPGQPTIRLDVAHGLRDGNTAVSAGWQIAWFTKARS